MTRRTALAGAAVAVAVVATVVTLLLVTGGSPSLDARVKEVAGQLRCPTCEAETAADSNTPIARSMRSEIRDQLRAGRSPAQIRGWFRDRYGDRVVLLPDTDGLGRLLWVAPVVLLAGGTGILLLRLRARRGPGSVAGRPEPAARLRGGALVGAGLVVVAAGVAVPTAVSGWGTDSTEPTAVENATASTAPTSSSSPAREAFELLRSGHPEQAAALARPVSRRAGPERSLAVLVLGLAQRDRGQSSYRRTLRHFLELAPDHPAAPQVRRLLREDQ